jgi:ABC-2 type transport system ATP-binding protein
MLCGLLQSTSGTALVGGHDINTETELVKANIGYMSQRFSLYNDLTVEQNLRFFGGVYGLRNGILDDRIRWVIDIARLQGRESVLTKTLAGGYKQRLALGCAVLHRPRILFLDEPTGGVDPLSRRHFWELIGQLSSQGVTVLVTTHFLDEAEYCNTIVLIDAGKLIANGSPTELKTKYVAHPMLELSTPSTVEALEAIEEESWALETSVFGTKLHVMVEEEITGRRLILDLLKKRGIQMERLERIVPSLEDVFLFLLDKARPTSRPDRLSDQMD